MRGWRGRRRDAALSLRLRECMDEQTDTLIIYKTINSSKHVRGDHVGVSSTRLLKGNIGCESYCHGSHIIQFTVIIKESYNDITTGMRT